MSSLKARISTATSATLLVFVMLAAPAGAVVLGGVTSALDPGGNGSSLLPQDGLDRVPGNPLEPLVPADPTDELDKILNPPPSDPQPTSKPSNQTRSAPEAAATPRHSPAPRHLKKTRSPSTLDSIKSGSSGSGSARVAQGGKVAARASRTRSSAYNPGAFHRSVPSSSSTGSSGPPAQPRSVVGRVVNRIPPQYRFAVLALTLISLFFALVSLRERRRSRRVERQALVDPLTRLPNREAFERRLAREWERAERYDRSLGMLLLDLDDFKQMNDTQGHAAGDAVLREVAAAVSGRIRASDMAARLGGDEFLVLCPETRLDGLKAIARSLEERLEQASIKSSIGFAEREPADLGPADLIARADAAMYRRKHGTRASVESRPRPFRTGEPLTGAAAD